MKVTDLTDEKTRAEELERRRKKKIAESVTEDFKNRREQRRKTESGWTLNVNFLAGNQYLDVTGSGALEETETQFYWQPKRVFNHVAPLVDARLAKMTTLRPTIRVRAFSDEDADVKSALLSTGILEFVSQRIGLEDLYAQAALWAETCGSAFYKITWDQNAGRQVATREDGVPIYEGEVNVSVISPYGIFPDRLDAENLDEVQSLIHAQVVPKKYVLEKFGVLVQADETEKSAFISGEKNAQAGEQVTLIERYTRPTLDKPEGALEIVAGGELLYEGGLPYLNGDRGVRGFPFVKQDCLRIPGRFFGTSMVERLIPVQRAYNAVRNRKHELLNRLSMGVVVVEDGAVDTDDLQEEGISPGKILIYRQGGKAPEMLDCGEVPSAFTKEEEWLEKEFTLVSGVSDLTQNSMPVNVTSASGLRLLLNEDNSRLAVTMANVRYSMKEVARHILRLYKQFAGSARLMTLTGKNKKTEIYYFNATELSSSDIVFETEDETTPEEKQEQILTLLKAGLFTDENGKLTTENKARILEAFGFGSYENARDISALHIATAGEENLKLMKGSVMAESYDDHDLHILEHTRFLLSSEFKKKGNAVAKERFCAHIAEHEKRKKKVGVNS